jgi:2-oxoglutarate/2-oxoacid ferredoxin oxidoreductase subunit beta
MHDGSKINLINRSQFCNISNKNEAMTALYFKRKKDEIMIGLIYLNQDELKLNEIINTTSKPLNQLTQEELFHG